MTAHEVSVTHLRSGFKRWLAGCSCGWSELMMGQADAEELAGQHDLDNDPTLAAPCSCFVDRFGRTEFEPSRCELHKAAS